MKTIEEKIKDIIEGMNDEAKIYFYMDYASYYGVDEYVYRMDELNDLFCGLSFTEGIDRIDLPNFNFNDEYIIDEVGYGALRSADESEVLEVISYALDYIIEKLVEDENSLYNDDIQAIFDEVEED